MNERHDNSERVEREVLKTLDCLDGIEHIEPSPYFFARLKNRIAESEDSRESLFGRLMFGYRLVPSLLALVLVFNALTVWTVLRGDDEDSYEARQEYVEAIASDYLLTGVSLAADIGTEQVN